MTTRVRPYLLATAAVAAVFVLRWLLAPVLGSSLPFITFFFAVFFAAWYGGVGPAVFAAVLGGLLAAAVFFPMPGGIDLSAASGKVGLVLFLISGLAMGAMGRARINGQRLAEEAARTANEAASEARAARSKTEAILAGISDGFMLLSRDWKILYLNAAALKLSGRSAAELIGRDHWEVFPESRGTLFESAYRRALDRMEVVRVEEYYPPIERWLSVTAYPSADGLSVFAQDVTEQRQAETLAQDTAAELEASNAELESALNEVSERRAALEQSEERVRLAMDVGAFGAWEWDIASNRVIWSSRLYDFYGISPEQFGGRIEDFERLVHPADASRVKAARERALETGEEFAIEYRTVQPGGAVRWLSTHGRVLRDAADRPARMIGATQDITERRVADERLRQVQRMEAAGRLAGGVAHEVNNQMTIVLGLTSFILRDQRLPDTVRDDMLQIQRAGERSAAITAQLLAFGRRQLLRPEPLQLNEVIADFSRVVEKSAGMSVGVRLRLDPDVAPVVADRAQLEQVLLNLTLNAVDAMPNGGTLTIETASAHIGPGYVREHPGVAVVKGDYSLIAVSDTGHGMTPEVLEHIFEPFFTTKSVGEGSGLGLSSVYGIVKQSDGYVWAYSEPGVGTTFKIYLPASPSAPAPAATSEMDGRRFAGTESVLVVDDERDVRALIVRLLEREGYRAYSAGSGHEALDLLRDGTREIHLVVTDVAMPGLSGSELGRRLGELRPGLPVLYTSGFTDADIVARGMLERSLPFLQKPFTPERLLERIRGILDQR